MLTFRCESAELFHPSLARTRAAIQVSSSAVQLQRKCAGCEEEERLSRAPLNSRLGFDFATIPIYADTLAGDSTVQRACACATSARVSDQRTGGADERRLEDGLQPKLKVNPPNDRYEQEADSLADTVMRLPEIAVRPAGRTDEASLLQMQRLHPTITRLLQRQPSSALVEEDEAPTEAKLQMRRARPLDVPEPDGAFEAALDMARPGGRGLEPGLRHFMEDRFGLDFAEVRVHTDPHAAALAAQVEAQAFTVGQHVFFGSGYYDPASTAGRTLIAHELVHTLQQSPAGPRRLSPANTAAAPVEAAVQRREAEVFIPEPKPSGTKIHADLLPVIGLANPDLFTEVKIPGATRLYVEPEQAGIADLYKVATGTETTIAVVMDQGTPAYLESDRKLRRGGERFPHQELGAPRGTARRGPKKPGADCPGGAAVCLLNAAPGKILIGDLKPPAIAETILGFGQLTNYGEGITGTSNALNQFIDENPGKVGPDSPKWTPSTRETRFHPRYRPR